MNESHPNTYAVVVGIEKYQKFPSLDGAALNALKFAEWLNKQGVSSDNILLFISALDENKKLVENYNFNRREATRDNIYNGVSKEIREKKGDLLYIFWAGHGYISDVESRRLFYTDDTENFNLSSLLKSLKTQTFSNFNRQIILIDACATYYKKSNEQLHKECFPLGIPKNNNEQVVLLATKAGSTAKYDEKEKIGLFSKVLLEELEKKQKLLVPEEIKEIQENVKKTFKEQYNNEQTPISLYSVDKDGNEEKLGLNQSGKYIIFAEEGWQELKLILSQIDRYRLYLGCRLVLSEFTKDIDGNYPKISTLKSKDTKVEEILDILQGILFMIMNPNEEQKTIFIVIKFIRYLIAIREPKTSASEKPLEKWMQKTANKLLKENINLDFIEKEIEENITNLRKEYKNCQPYLMITCEPNISEEDKFYLSAELIFQAKNDEPNLIVPIDEKINCLGKLADIQCQLDRFISFTIKTIRLYGFNNEQLIVEMFLPNNQLIKFSEESYEKIEIKIDISGSRKWISCQYKFALRSWSRLQNISEGYIDLKPIQKKWDQLDFVDLRQPTKCQWIDFQNQTQFEHDCLDIVLMNLLSTPKILQQKDKINQLLEKQVIHKGLPLFIWIIYDNPGQFQNQVEELLAVNNLDTLLENIKNKRACCFENGRDTLDLGYHLGFLCDNPYRLPSQYSIIGGDILISLGF